MGDLQYALGKIEKLMIESNGLTEKFLSLFGLEKMEINEDMLVVYLEKKIDYKYELSFCFDANKETFEDFKEIYSIINKRFKIEKAQVFEYQPLVYKKSSRLIIQEDKAITTSTSNPCWATLLFENVDSSFYIEIIIEKHSGAGHIRLGMMHKDNPIEGYLGSGNSFAIYPSNYVQGIFELQGTNCIWAKGDKIGFYFEKSDRNGTFYQNGVQVAEVKNIPTLFFPALTIHCVSDMCYLNKEAKIPKGKKTCRILHLN